jgi:hypothetical protein
VSVDGLPIENALVYLLPKSQPGAHDVGDVPTAATIGDGSFQLLVSGVEGCWLCCIAEGYLPAFLGGPEARAKGDIKFVLHRGPTLSLVIHEGGRPHPHVATRVSISTAQGGGDWLLPGPRHDPHVTILATVPESGVLLQSVGCSGPITVAPIRIGYYAVPESATLPGPEGHVEFTMYPSPGVRLHVMDEMTQRPISSRVRVEVLDPESESMVNGAVFSSPLGEYELNDRLRPGTFRLRVLAEGYQVWQQDDLLLTSRPDRQDIVVRLTPDRARATLLVHFPQLAPPDPYPPTCMARIDGGAAESPSPTWTRWRPWLLRNWDSASSTARIGLPSDVPAHFIFFDPAAGVAAWQTDGLAPGARLDASLELEAGVTMPPPKRDVSGHPLVHLGLSTEGGLDLPTLRFKGRGVRTVSSPGEILQLPRLGPYPWSPVLSHAVYDDGTVLDERYSKTHSKGG